MILLVYISNISKSFVWFILISAVLTPLFCVVVNRDGCTWFFDQLQATDIPLLIFSAGIGDVIIEVIKHQATLHDNMKVVSNYLEYDDQVCHQANLISHAA